MASLGRDTFGISVMDGGDDNGKDWRLDGGVFRERGGGSFFLRRHGSMKGDTAIQSEGQDDRCCSAPYRLQRLMDSGDLSSEHHPTFSWYVACLCWSSMDVGMLPSRRYGLSVEFPAEVNLLPTLSYRALCAAKLEAAPLSD
jgi:hypothetical protein